MFRHNTKTFEFKQVNALKLLDKLYLNIQAC